MIHDKERTISQINEICDFIDVNKKAPSHLISDWSERRLGSKLQNMISDSRGIGKGVFLEEYKNLFESRGYSHLFRNSSEKTLSQIEDICMWINTYGEYPRATSVDKIEKQLGIKINSLRDAKKGKGVFLEEYQELVTKLGYPKIFDKVNKEENGLIIITKLCDFMDENNRRPLQKSDEALERKLAEKISSLKKAKSGKKGVYFESYQNLINTRGYSTIFDTKKKGEATKWTN